jgi:deoxycytidine triphosphate deaminase
MEPLTGKEAATRVAGMISPKHQVHGYSVDLTVRNIATVDPVGRVDFGGSEFTRAGKMELATYRPNPEDKYNWWDVSRGSYFVEFNETIALAEDEIGFLEPDERLLRAGASHSSVFLRGRIAPVETVLEVGTLRVQIKQNARISRLRVFRLGAAKAATQRSAVAKPAKKRK